VATSATNTELVKFPTDIDDPKVAAAIRLLYNAIDNHTRALSSLKDQLTALEARVTALGG
jgi:hypothetical protein